MGPFLCYNELMKISLIITVYNKKPFLKRCLDSVANQTEKDAQIIIVDDCSTDGSEKICDEYAKEYGWEVYHKKRNGGVSLARNYGMNKAKGEYIAFLDADDAFIEDALDVMTRITRHGYNIIQFGQYRYVDEESRPILHECRKGHYDMFHRPRHWAMVWNKIYRAEFLKEHKIKFISGMQFGEDEMFNVECLIANKELYHAPQNLIRHYFDDDKSLCRGELTLDRLMKLDEKLCQLLETTDDKQFVRGIIERHRRSKLFKEKGYTRRKSGKYDIVYFLKKADSNEELRYSLRSVEENWQYNDVWFYGGCPKDIVPDHHVKAAQRELSKWERVRGMLYTACCNDEITEDFWLFNDDFFVMTPHSEDMPQQYNKTLQERIESIESKHGNSPSEYSRRLRHLVGTLEEAGKGFLDYSVHKPILINRKKMKEVLDKFPDEPMSRALYGNYWEIGGESKPDMKIQKTNYGRAKIAMQEWDFISTSDESFSNGNIGVYLRDRFNQPSRFEL